MIRSLRILRSPVVLGSAGAALLAIAAPHAGLAAPAGPFTVNVGGSKYQILTTDPIDYATLSGLSGGVYSGYSLNFDNPLNSSAFAEAFFNQVDKTAVNKDPANTVATGSQVPAVAPVPNMPGGPLFFTHYNAANPPFSTNTSATGDYFVTVPSSSVFSSYQGGVAGVLAQTHIWAMWKKVQAPGPLPIVGAAAAFGFSRRLRKRVRSSQA
jgi:hypothetical protein